MSLFDRADGFIAAFDTPDADHNRLTRLEGELAEFDRKLDERALTLQNIK